MALTDYARSLAARWRFLVVGIVIGACAGGLVAMTATRTYVSSTQFFVAASTSATSDAYTGNLFSQMRASSYVQVLTGVELAQRVADELDVDLSATEVSQKISASVVPDTVILDVSVTDTSPRRAQQIAQELGRAFPDVVDELETPSGESTSPVKVTVLTPASLPAGPSSPNVPFDVTAGLLLGFVLGALGALLRERADTRLRDTDQAGVLAQAPVLGVVVEDQSLVDHRPLDAQSPPAVAESFRQIRTNLDYVGVDVRPQVLLITSSVSGEGKSTVATSLAVVLAESGKKVLLIEADLRRPRVTQYLNLVSGAGLTSVLTGAAPLDAVTQDYGSAGLTVLAAGPTPPNPSEMLASTAMSDLLKELRSEYDVVVVDGPPLLPVADAGALAPLTDGVVLVTGWAIARREEVEQSRRALQRVGIRPLGVVVTKVPPRAAAVQGYGYGYGYGQSEAADSPADSGSRTVLGRAARKLSGWRHRRPAGRVPNSPAGTPRSSSR
jgi:succinoglycan biosynthesis transport protein ExoP